MRRGQPARAGRSSLRESAQLRAPHLALARAQRGAELARCLSESSLERAGEHGRVREPACGRHRPDRELRTYVRFLVDHGLHDDRATLLAGGAAGDFSTMTFDERVQLCQRPRRVRTAPRPSLGAVAVAFRRSHTLGTRKHISFVATYPRPTRSRAYASPNPLPSPAQGSLPAGRAHPSPGGFRTRWMTNKVSWGHRILHSPSTSLAWSHEIQEIFHGYGVL